MSEVTKESLLKEFPELGKVLEDLLLQKKELDSESSFQEEGKAIADIAGIIGKLKAVSQHRVTAYFANSLALRRKTFRWCRTVDEVDGCTQDHQMTTLLSRLQSLLTEFQAERDTALAKLVQLDGIPDDQKLLWTEEIEEAQAKVKACSERAKTVEDAMGEIERLTR